MSRRLSRYVNCAKTMQRYLIPAREAPSLIVALVSINTRAEVSRGHMTDQLGEDRPARQHPALSRSAFPRPVCPENRRSHTISLRSRTALIASGINQLRANGAAATG